MAIDFAISERPCKLSQIVGNASVVRTLQSAIDRNVLPQAIMFTGESSTGKTTIINCLRNEMNIDDLNYHEIDCGLSASIEDSRAIAEALNYTPFGGMSEKVMFVLEEVHKLSGNKKAQEGFLRLLENLPENVYIFSSTTNPELLLPQFRNRFTQFRMSPLSDKELALGIIRPICEKYGFMISKPILIKIIELSQGVPRTALHLLYSIHSLPPDEQDIVLENECKATVDFFKLYQKLLRKENFDVVDLCHNLLSNGDPEQTRRALLKLIEKTIMNAKLESEIVNSILFYECLKSVDYDSPSSNLISAIYKYMKG